MNNASIPGILTIKKIHKTPTSSSFASYIRQLCLPYKTPAAVSQYIQMPFSTVPLFNLRNILMEPFAMFNGDGSHIFRKKNPHGNAENEVSLTCYTP
jgi:hypothetical protein